MVYPKTGGPYSLFCDRCRVWIPNTANHEMKKEGFIAHSHVCGVASSDEISEEEWAKKQAAKLAAQ